MAIQLLMSAGRNTSERSLIIISRSESRNSRTRLRFFFDEKTSRSYKKYSFFSPNKVVCASEGPHTSITFWCFSSWRYFTSRMADISRPSLNCPTLIFLIATLRPVVNSLPRATLAVRSRISGNASMAYLDIPPHTLPLQPFVPSP